MRKDISMKAYRWRWRNANDQRTTHKKLRWNGWSKCASNKCWNRIIKDFSYDKDSSFNQIDFKWKQLDNGHLLDTLWQSYFLPLDFDVVHFAIQEKSECQSKYESISLFHSYSFVFFASVGQLGTLIYLNITISMHDSETGKKWEETLPAHAHIIRTENNKKETTNPNFLYIRFLFFFIICKEGKAIVKRKHRRIKSEKDEEEQQQKNCLSYEITVLTIDVSCFFSYGHRDIRSKASTKAIKTCNDFSFVFYTSHSYQTLYSHQNTRTLAE